MKKLLHRIMFVAAFLIFCCATEVQAAEEETILDGVYVDAVSLGSMTEEEAIVAMQNYLNELRQTEITLVAAGNEEVVVTGADLGISWTNQDVIKEALNVGKCGNVIARYKQIKDLTYEDYVLPMELDFDINAINSVIVEQCVPFDQEAMDYHLVRVDEQFTVEEGRIGYVTDVEHSIDIVYDTLTQNWSNEGSRIVLDITEDIPKGSAEELMQVKDVLGTFTTSFATSGSSRSGNVKNGCRLVDATTLYPGEEFSMLEKLLPFSTANGYFMAGSYLNGQVVDSLGGGICQVSSTLYNAVLNAELEIAERHNHSMIVNYVSAAADAAIAESSGKDFKFVNNTDYPIYIEGFTTPNKRITFNIYGVETRDTMNREVIYESVILEVIHPDTEILYPDPAQGVGYIDEQSAHIGYKAQLWKIVKENGAEVSRTQVNSSNYKVSPRSAIVGVATDNPDIYNAMMEAIATNSVDHVKNVAAMFAPPVVVETPPAEVTQ